MSQITDAPDTPGATTVDTTPSDDAATFAELHDLVEDAVALANRWSDATEAGQTKAEKRTSDQLGALLRDEKGLDLAVKFVDRVARPEDNTAAARELARLSSNEATGFMGKLDAKLLGLGSRLATTMPPVVVPAARTRLRQLVGHLVVDASDPTLAKHLAKAHADGFRLNINLLGEAVLGETEAARRTEETRKLLARDDVDYVSIKVSCLVSQISTWDAEGTVERALERLRPIYRVANGTASDASSPSSNTGDANADAGQPGGGAANVNRGDIKKKFVNLDMEEYRDLDLTIELFTRLLSEPEFHDLEAGIVLQAYLPDAVPALERLIAFAKERKANGGAGIKVRLVKGANLAMERVEAELHDWKQAPYTSKEDVDANYLRFIERATRADA
ncbi:proline dehydrogenase family protein, partial [Dermacoccus sp. UBA1591]